MLPFFSLKIFSSFLFFSLDFYLQVLIFLSFDGNRNNPRTAEPSRTKKKILDKVCPLIVLTIIFSLYGYDGLGLGFPRERKNVLFLSCPQDYELKSQVLCEFKKITSKNFSKSKKTCEFDCYPFHKNRRQPYERTNKKRA